MKNRRPARSALGPRRYSVHIAASRSVARPARSTFPMAPSHDLAEKHVVRVLASPAVVVWDEIPASVSFDACGLRHREAVHRAGEAHPQAQQLLAGGNHAVRIGPSAQQSPDRSQRVVARPLVAASPSSASRRSRRASCAPSLLGVRRQFQYQSFHNQWEFVPGDVACPR